LSRLFRVSHKEQMRAAQFPTPLSVSNSKNSQEKSQQQFGQDMTFFPPPSRVLITPVPPNISSQQTSAR
jgi:hypothetical protein